MNNFTIQIALFFDIFFYFFDVSEYLALISRNMLIYPVYDFGRPILENIKFNFFILYIYTYI